MYCLRTDSAAGIWIVAVIIATLFCMSCGFADLRPLEAGTSPKEQDTVLQGEYSPLSVWFNTGMVRKEAENLLQVSSDTGMVEGDRFWNGNTLVFVPAAGWTAGTRYLLSLSGIARSLDGRELRLERYVSFFALNRSAPPFVEWHSPSDGESVGANDLRMEIRFSQAMDRSSVESSLTVEGMADKKTEWSGDGRTITVTSEKSLSPWAVYQWTLKTGAKSADGVPLVQAFSAVFSTDLDRVMPQVSRVYPVLYSDGAWFPAGGSIEDNFGPGLGVAVEFNKPMAEAVLRSLRFEPSLPGRTEKLSEKSIVFIPNRDPEPETVYTLIVSSDAADTEGLKTGAEYRRVFTADIPYLKILSFNASNGSNADPQDGNIFRVPASEADGGLVRFTVHFSLPFDDEAKQKTALAVSLSPFFPASLDPVALRSVSWLAGDRLAMEWERLVSGGPEEAHYYRLSFPGGRGGVENGGGMYLKQDINLYLEAIQ